uniref:Ribosomal RNA-processing protein 43 n=1 Tax=Mesocestoides corti TaxID=53468 RepID=A0A5K3FQY8_MESCO
MTAKLYSVVRGKVVSIKEFGAFVSIEGSDRQGLLHRSCISNHPVDDVAEVLEVGERILVKIISDKDGKLGLSMKVVNQTTGEDMDPNNLIIAQMEKRRKGEVRGQSPIRLEAELNTVCKRCGIKGHLASSCFALSGETPLGLLPSDSEEETPRAPETEKEKASKHKKKSKHHKRHRSESKKSKHRGRSRSPFGEKPKKHRESIHRRHRCQPDHKSRK